MCLFDLSLVLRSGQVFSGVFDSLGVRESSSDTISIRGSQGQFYTQANECWFIVQTNQRQAQHCLRDVLKLETRARVYFRQRVKWRQLFENAFLALCGPLTPDVFVLVTNHYFLFKKDRLVYLIFSLPSAKIQKGALHPHFEERGNKSCWLFLIPDNGSHP